MRNKMKRFGKRVLLPAMAATIMTMASVSTKVYAAGGDGGGTAAVTKPLDNLKKNIETITSSTEAIRKANAKIEETCANISNKYILEIEAKINKFQINLERTYKRHKID